MEVLFSVPVDSINLKHVTQNMLQSQLSGCIHYPHMLQGPPVAGARVFSSLSLHDGQKMPLSPFFWGAGRKAEVKKLPSFIVTHAVKHSPTIILASNSSARNTFLFQKLYLKMPNKQLPTVFQTPKLYDALRLHPLLCRCDNSPCAEESAPLFLGY